MSWWLVPEVLIFGALWIWLVGLVPAAVVCLLKGRLAMFFAGFFESQPCRHHVDGTWTCSKYNSAVSGTVAYRVRVGGLGCWTAVRSERVGVGSPRHLSGCLNAWDQLRLFG